MLFDFNQSGKVDFADLLVLAQNPAVRKPLITTLAYYVAQSETKADDNAVLLLNEIFSVAAEVVEAGDKPSPQALIGNAAELLDAIVDSANQEAKSYPVVKASHDALQALLAGLVEGLEDSKLTGEEVGAALTGIIPGVLALLPLLSKQE